MPSLLHRTAASRTAAAIVGALAAFAVTPSRVNVIATPEVLPDESGFTCRPFGTQLADGGFNELCRFEPQAPPDAGTGTGTSEPPQGLSYYEDRLDGLWKCTDSGCVLEKAKAPRPAKPSRPVKSPRPAKPAKASTALPEPPC